MAGRPPATKRESPIHRIDSRLRRPLAVACCLLAAPLAAAAAGSRTALEEAVRARGLAPEQLIWPWRLGSQTSAWLAGQALGRRPAERLQVAFHQLLEPDGRGLRYDATATGTAEEVFAGGRANCLGFTMLFVGIARELGVEAYFLRVEEVESYHREGDLIFVAEHLTAGYVVDGEVRHVEFTLGPPADYRSARRIPDLTALALFYSNRGVEVLAAGDAARAVRWLETAVRLDRREAAAWTNLGVARRRLGEHGAAEASYREAIAVDASHLPAYMNLGGLLRGRGEAEAAREILRLLDRGDNRNPHAYLALGDASLRDGHLEEARRYYRQAVRHGRRQAEPLAAMGLVALAGGDEHGARRWLRRARRAGGSDDRTRRLERDLGATISPPSAAATAGSAEPSDREVES